ncbi:hypothetical protein JAAARDRAFT_139412, partial [Jaapia argillacea MUCL 33604]
IEKEYFTETGRNITWSHSTLASLAKGGKPRAVFNSEKSWLLDSEVDKIIEYAITVTERGFPLSHRWLREHVNEICHARLGQAFPQTRVGKNWTHHFVMKYSNRLTMYTARPLDTARARGVNLTTNAAWFKLLGKTLERGDAGKPIAAECCWGVDKSGFQSGLGDTQEKAIRGKGKKIQYQQRDGDRENITVIVTIGADSSSIPPAVIFKGKAYQSKWKQDNPAEAS